MEGDKLKDENGSLLPKNFVEQFRELQNQNEAIKERLDYIQLDLKRIENKVDNVGTKVNSIDETVLELKVNLKQVNSLIEESVLNTNKRVDILENKINLLIKYIIEDGK